MNSYWKWFGDSNTLFCAKVKHTLKDTLYADYYKNGKLYAENQIFIKRISDIEITFQEFQRILNQNV